MTVDKADGFLNRKKWTYLRQVLKLESVGFSDGLNAIDKGNKGSQRF